MLSTPVIAMLGIEVPNLLAQCIVFGAVYFVLNRYAFGPVVAMLEARRKRIAEKLRKKASQKARSGEEDDDLELDIDIDIDIDDSDDDDLDDDEIDAELESDLDTGKVAKVAETDVPVAAEVYELSIVGLG